MTKKIPGATGPLPHGCLNLMGYRWCEACYKFKHGLEDCEAYPEIIRWLIRDARERYLAQLDQYFIQGTSPYPDRPRGMLHMRKN